MWGEYIFIRYTNTNKHTSSHAKNMDTHTQHMHTAHIYVFQYASTHSKHKITFFPVKRTYEGYWFAERKCESCTKF